MNFKNSNHPLKEIIDALSRQADIRCQAYFSYLDKEAERKHFESRIINESSGKSHAERVIQAQATSDWLTFHKELARLDAMFEYHKFRYEILDKEYLAQYQELKLNDGLIKRQG